MVAVVSYPFVKAKIEIFKMANQSEEIMGISVNIINKKEGKKANRAKIQKVMLTLL